MTAGDPVSDAEFVAIQRFVHQEAALLDRRDYQAWLDLLTDDIDYRVTAQVARDAATGMEEYAIVDEDAHTLRMRVEQIADPRLTRAENPPSLTRRFVSNIVAEGAAPPDAFVVEANLLVYRSRTTAPEGGFYVGQRHDVLRRAEDGLRIAARHVRLDQTVLRDGSLSTLL
jgi:3-phenylpropionate/cinnamic acid dioxygenase small subunit